MASSVNSELPLKLDNILLHPDKITIINASSRLEAAEALKSFVENLKRIARIALKEHDADVEETAKYLYESPYREIWEAIKGRRVVSLQQIYSELHITGQDEETKKTRNFFTNTKIVLKARYPFVSVEKGNYELNFFGILVWKQYQSSYLSSVEKKETNHQAVTTEEDVGKDNEENRRETTLNNFLKDRKVHETIYGKKV